MGVANKTTEVLPKFLHLKILKEIMLKDSTYLLKKLSVYTLFFKDFIDVCPITMQFGREP